MWIFALLVLLVGLVCWTPSAVAGKGKGVLVGKQVMPREISAVGHEHWQNYELTKMIATTLAESQGFVGAFHDNFADDQNTVLESRDCGAMEINIPAARIGTAVEDGLRTESFDEDIWRPVLKNNIAAGKRLYDQAWTRDGKPDIRRWQPWVAYTTGWATFPEWWVWHQNTQGVPVGPWYPTGRYIQRAIAGQMNMHLVIFKDWSDQRALLYARQYADHFGVKGELYINSQGIVTWKVPPRPSAPPSDGIGPRPEVNDGV